jgi:hypothetical protein
MGGGSKVLLFFISKIIKVTGQLHDAAALAHGTHWIRGWANLRADLNAEVCRKYFASVDNQTLTVQPVSHRYSD